MTFKRLNSSVTVTCSSLPGWEADDQTLIKQNFIIFKNVYKITFMTWKKNGFHTKSLGLLITKWLVFWHCLRVKFREKETGNKSKHRTIRGRTICWLPKDSISKWLTKSTRFIDYVMGGLEIFREDICKYYKLHTNMLHTQNKTNSICTIFPIRFPSNVLTCILCILSIYLLLCNSLCLTVLI